MIIPSDSWQITQLPEPENSDVTSVGNSCANDSDEDRNIRIKYSINKLSGYAQIYDILALFCKLPLTTKKRLPEGCRLSVFDFTLLQEQHADGLAALARNNFGEIVAGAPIATVYREFVVTCGEAEQALLNGTAIDIIHG